jgi:hypothetical protein
MVPDLTYSPLAAAPLLRRTPPPIAGSVPRQSHISAPEARGQISAKALWPWLNWGRVTRGEVQFRSPLTLFDWCQHPTPGSPLLHPAKAGAVLDRCSLWPLELLL